jgi:hypothetical protein
MDVYRYTVARGKFKRSRQAKAERAQEATVVDDLSEADREILFGPSIAPPPIADEEPSAPEPPVLVMEEADEHPPSDSDLPPGAVWRVKDRAKSSTAHVVMKGKTESVCRIVKSYADTKMDVDPVTGQRACKWCTQWVAEYNAAKRAGDAAESAASSAVRVRQLGGMLSSRAQGPAASADPTAHERMLVNSNHELGRNLQAAKTKIEDIKEDLAFVIDFILGGSPQGSLKLALGILYRCQGHEPDAASSMAATATARLVPSIVDQLSKEEETAKAEQRLSHLINEASKIGYNYGLQTANAQRDFTDAVARLMAPA